MYLFFDTETTGLPRRWDVPPTNVANWPRLVQLAWIQYEAAGQPGHSVSRIVRPEGFRIPRSASAVHGITTEQALEQGVPLATVLEEFAEALRSTRLLVAHNMLFDAGVMEAEFLRQGMTNALAAVPKLCTMRASADFCRLAGKRGHKWPRLPELYRVLFDEEFAGVHDAMADAQACARCFFELVRRGAIQPDA